MPFMVDPAQALQQFRNHLIIRFSSFMLEVEEGESEGGARLGDEGTPEALRRPVHRQNEVADGADLLLDQGGVGGLGAEAGVDHVAEAELQIILIRIARRIRSDPQDRPRRQVNEIRLRVIKRERVEAVHHLAWILLVLYVEQHHILYDLLCRRRRRLHD